MDVKIWFHDYCSVRKKHAHKIVTIENHFRIIFHASMCTLFCKRAFKKFSHILCFRKTFRSEKISSFRTAHKLNFEKNVSIVTISWGTVYSIDQLVHPFRNKRSWSSKEETESTEHMWLGSLKIESNRWRSTFYFLFSSISSKFHGWTEFGQ